MIGNDGDSCAVMYQWNGDLEELDFLRHHVLHAPYLMLERPRVLAIGLGGGADVLNALRNDAREVTGVEINPMTVHAGRELFRAWNGDLLNRPGVEAVVAEGRSFLRSRSERYDLIEINSVDTLSALSTGAYVLSESFLYTSDAVRDYLDHLEPGGIFAMAVGDAQSDQPPRHTLRLAGIVRAPRGAAWRAWRP
jgi:spermidine synthase